MSSTRSQTLRNTKLKRTTQTCKVYELKVDKSRLNKETKNHLKMLFIEGKWLYNNVLNQKNIKDFNTKIKNVNVKVIDVFENREFHYISSQMKQAIKDRTFHNILSLSALKKQGYKIGRLKFKSKLNSIPLKQHNNSFTLLPERKSVKIQGVKQYLPVYGFNQLPEIYEVANATLIQKNKEYYIKVAIFTNKIEENITDESISIDFGCETQMTLSNRLKIEFQVPISERIKCLDRKIMKKHRKNSKNKEKDKLLRAKAYEKITNQKKDIRNKVVNALVKNYKVVCVQDENIHAWHSGRHGKKIQHSGIGGIIRDLKIKSHTLSVVGMFFPSTKLCPVCGKKNILEEKDRIYECECGYIEDRDIKSALCIEREGIELLRKSGVILSDKILNKYRDFDFKKASKPCGGETAAEDRLPMDSREVKLQDIRTSAMKVQNILKNIPRVHISSFGRVKKPLSFS